MNEFPTPPFEATISEWTPSLSEYQNLASEKDRLASQLEQMTRNWEYSSNKVKEFTRKEQNVQEIIETYFNDNGELTDELTEIAEALGLSLMKEYNVSVTVTWSGTVRVPLGDDDIDSIVENVDFTFDEGYSDAEWDVSEDSRDWDVQESY